MALFMHKKMCLVQFLFSILYCVIFQWLLLKISLSQFPGWRELQLCSKSLSFISVCLGDEVLSKHIFSNYSTGSLTKISFGFVFIPHFIYPPFPTECCGSFKLENTRENPSFPSRNSQVCLLQFYDTKVGRKTPLDYEHKISKCWEEEIICAYPGSFF